MTGYAGVKTGTRRIDDDGNLAFVDDLTTIRQRGRLNDKMASGKSQADNDELNDRLLREVTKNIKVPFKLQPWQEKARQIILNKQDLFLVVPPAAGKTEPLVRAWAGAYYQDYLGGYISITDANDIPLDAFWKNFENVLEYYKSNGLLTHYIDRLRHNSPNRIAYIVPRKRLAVSIANNDFKNIFFDMLMTVNNENRPSKNNLIAMFQDFISIQESGFNESDLFSKSSLFGHFDFKLKPVVVGTYEPMSKLLSKYARHFQYVVIDEFQEFAPRGNNNLSANQMKENNQEEMLKRYDALSNIIKNTKAPGKCGLGIMTGSMSKEVVTDLAEFFDNEFNRKFKNNIIAFSGQDDQLGQARNRSNIIVLPFEKMKTRQEKIKLITDKIVSNSTNNLMVLFSVNRKSQNSIFRIMEEIIPTLPKKDASTLFSNFDVNFKDKSENLEDEINKHKNNYIGQDVPELMSKEEINHLMNTDVDKLTSNIQKLNDRVGNILNDINSNNDNDDNNIKTNIDEDNDSEAQKINKLKNTIDKLEEIIPRENENLSRFEKLKEIFNSLEKKINRLKDKLKKLKDEQRKVGQINEIEFLKYFDVDIAESKGSKDISSPAPVLKSPDSNNILYQGALRGIGFLIGNMHRQHSSTIIKLFVQKKLNFLLATDSVGVGMNVKVQHLYIPTLVKPGEQGFGSTDKSTIVQILNRAGRNPSDFQTAYIYVGKDDVDELKELADPNNDYIDSNVLAINPIPYGEFKKFLKESSKSAVKSTIMKILTGNLR